MTTPEIYSAAPQLAALVTVMRPDWPAEDVHAAIAGAHQAGLTWAKTCVGLVRLAVDPDGRPRDLIPVHKDPQRRRDPEVYDRGAAEVREALANTREDDTP
jgi:hypothetical protein